MTRYEDISTDAAKSFLAGHQLEAVLLYRQAASVALQMGDRHAWYHSTVWAAISASCRGDYDTAMTLLLEARNEEPPDPPEFAAWNIRDRFFSIVLRRRPQLRQLRKLLLEMKLWASEHPVPPADILLQQACLAETRGDWQQMLKMAERGVVSHDGNGYASFHCYEKAALACLRLRTFEQTHNWLQEMADRDREHSVAAATVEEIKLRLSIAEAAPTDELRQQLMRFEESALSVENLSLPLRELKVRTCLLLFPEQDPLARFHPARQAYLDARSLHAIPNVHRRFENRLLLVDFRLAALRFAVGCPPVDDDYYTTPQQLSPTAAGSDHDVIRQRISKTAAAAAWAMKLARELDQALECDWRQRTVLDRSERLKQVVTHLAIDKNKGDT